jgi:hypothetical protein
MLTLEEIGQSVRNNVQLIIDGYGLPLAVGPISDDDYKILAGGFGELEWDCGLSRYGNDPNKYEFCIKIVNHECNAVAPSGAALCIYDDEAKIFLIHLIENFERRDDSHPLKGRMVLITLMSALIFCMAVEGQLVQIVEPVPELLEYYASFGFIASENGKLMHAELSSLYGVFESFSKLVAPF